MSQELGLQIKKDGKKANNPRSLIISPNLEALLEHEERLRGNIALSSPPPPYSSDVSSPTFPRHTSPGLPPPPRGPRKPRPLTQGVANPGSTSIQIPSRSLPARGVDSDIAQTTRSNIVTSSIGSPPSSSTSNPYINPAPSMEDVLEEDGDQSSTALSQPPLSTVNTLPETHEEEDRTDTVSLPLNLGFQILPRDETRSATSTSPSERLAIPQRSPSLPQSQSRSLPSSRADKFITIDNSTTNFFSNKNDQPSISQRLPLSDAPLTPNLRDPVQSKGKLPRLKEKIKSPGKNVF